jgi:VWFA-related protein
MKYRFPLAFVLVPQLAMTSAMTSMAQQPAPPAPPPAAVQQQPATKSQPQEEEVVRITTNLVQVDAVVTDKSGKPVTDLKPEEVEILEDGKPQKITNFSFVTAESKTTPGPVGKAVPVDKNAAPAPPVRLRPEQVRRTIAVVVDDLGLSFESAYYVRRALKKFLDEQIQPGDLVAIIRTGAGIGALQQFTSDKRMLYAAVERIKWNPLGRGGVGAFAPISNNQTPSLGSSGEEDTASNSQSGEDMDQFREEVLTVGTLGAINYVVKGLRELPGRKSVLLVSDGIKMFNPGDLSRNIRTQAALSSLIDLANRASVVIYTLDARGLQTLGLTAADNVSGMSRDQIQQSISNRSRDLWESQSGLSYLAQQTGGIAIRNSNDLSGGIRRVMEDQKSYYLIGYRPDESTFDQKTGRRKFHKLDLRVTRPGKFIIRMRKGFYGITDDEARPQVASTPQQQIIRALISPFGAAGVHVRLTSLFGNAAGLGSFVRSLLHIDAGDLTFTDQPDGFHKAEFDVLAVTFGDNGTVIDQVSKTYTLRVREKAYQRVLKEGFVYFVTVPVKKPGAYQLRAALRDHGSERVGSASQFVEVPDIKKKRLTVSGVVANGLEPGQKKPEKSGGAQASSSSAPVQPATNDQEEISDPDNSAAVRRFHRGGILQYAFVIYNAQLDKATNRPQLATQVRLFRDGQPIFTGKEIPFPSESQADFQRLTAGGAIQLGTGMEPGEYVLQVIVIDALAKEKYRTATQWIDFEIVK